MKVCELCGNEGGSDRERGKIAKIGLCDACSPDKPTPTMEQQADKADHRIHGKFGKNRTIVTGNKHPVVRPEDFGPED